MQPIEAAPLDDLDVTEEQATRLLEFSYSAERLTTSSHAISILMRVARHSLLYGECRTSHKEFGRRSGACRRTIDVAIKKLKRLGLIERVGTTDNGVAIYRADIQPGHA